MWKFCFAAVALIGLSFGVAPAMAQDTAASQIDISKAGTTAAEHQAFVKAMSPEQQASVVEACVPVIMKPATDTPAAVTAFCKTVGDSGIPAAGTTAAENTTFVNGLPADKQASLKAVCAPATAQPADASAPMMLMSFCKNVATQ